ncbi:MAG: hypothetical protein QOI66_4508 [Myxococcales bacterium]|nr:hypothetical protein [Myxococcales bacterium]
MVRKIHLLSAVLLAPGGDGAGGGHLAFLVSLGGLAILASAHVGLPGRLLGALRSLDDGGPVKAGPLAFALGVGRQTVHEVVTGQGVRREFLVPRNKISLRLPPPPGGCCGAFEGVLRLPCRGFRGRSPSQGDGRVIFRPPS